MLSRALWKIGEVTSWLWLDRADADDQPELHTFAVNYGRPWACG